MAENIVRLIVISYFQTGLVSPVRQSDVGVPGAFYSKIQKQKHGSRTYLLLPGEYMSASLRFLSFSFAYMRASAHTTRAGNIRYVWYPF